MNSYDIKFITRTWNKESYSLYDYESTDILKESFKIISKGMFIRESNRLKYLTDSINEKDEFRLERQQTSFHQLMGKPIFSISQNNGIWNLCNEDQEDRICRVISQRLLEGRPCSYRLKEGDIFKLGRMGFKVLRIENTLSLNQNYYQNVLRTTFKIDNKNIEEENSLTQTYYNPTLEINEMKESVKDSLNEGGQHSICKFCLSASTNHIDPLISVCKCSGSLKYVHIQCLKSWFSSKLKLEENKPVVCLLWDQLKCELCKTTMPLKLRYGDKFFNLLDFNNSVGDKPNIVLELISKENETNGLCFIDFSKKSEILIGRSNDCEIKLGDISVSRMHAKIKFENNFIQIIDNNSKFGTIIVEKEPISITEEKQYFQIGRTIIETYIKKKWFSRIMCFGCEKVSHSNDKKSLIFN